ncbi:MAG: flagellar motor protein MotB [Cyanobacteria bacterium REEB65]|nr:flagellar motor protein MotB [Cyanobacteria bacterium REEB65]
MKYKPGHNQGHGEPWLITYSDMVTLLMSLFIVIVSVSKVDQNKAEELTQQFHKATGATSKASMPFHEIKQKVDKVIQDAHLQKLVQAKLTPQGVNIEFSSSVFFDAGKANLKPAAMPLLDKTAAALAPISKTNVTIDVEGHTDATPIHTAQFPSNWELSTARATQVVRYMIGKGVNEGTLQAEGLAATHPKVDDKTQKAIAPNDPANRRVVIRIIREGT